MFYKLPQELFKNEKYNGLSNDAKILYVYLFARSEMSLKNGWIDEEGKPYIYCTREDMTEFLSVSLSTCVRIYRQLTECGLVRAGKKNGNASAKIYVTNLLSRSETVSKQEMSNHDLNRITDTRNTLFARFMEQ